MIKYSHPLSKLFWMLALLLCCLHSRASEEGAGTAILTIAPTVEDSVIVRSEYLIDETNVATVEQIREVAMEANWQALIEDFANFGYQAHPYWYRFSIANQDSQSLERIIELSYPLLDRVDLYEYDENNNLVSRQQVGDRVPYSSRPIEHPNFLFPIRLEAGETHHFFMRVETAGSQLVPLKLWKSTELFVQLGKEDALHATYFGVVSVIIFFNLLIFIALRERTYLYYSLAAFMYMLFFAIMRAKLYPYVFSDSPEFHHLLLLLLPSSCLLFSALFAKSFLQPKAYSQKLNLVINIIIGIALAGLAGVVVLEPQTSLKFSVMSVLPGSFVLFLLGPVLGFMGNRMAWIYTAAWSTVMVGAAITAMSKQGLMPVSFVTEYGMQIGSALELFILNAALASRFYREHKQRVAAQEAQIQENTVRREAERNLLNKSLSDAATLLPNRSCFEIEVHNALNSRGNERIAVCVIEILRYPEVARTLGHHNSELMLREVGQHLNETMLALPGIMEISAPLVKSKVCALEHGSFGMLVNADIAEADQDLVNQLLRRTIQPIEFKEMRLELRPVIGVAVCPEHGVNAVSLLRHAQVAADSSEAFERHLSYYKPEYDQYNARRLMMVSELKEAIRDNHLSLYFQPKLQLDTQSIEGVEALVRWNHPRYGLVRPDEFIGIAEQTGIIRPLTRWVVSEALKTQKKLKDLNFDLNMSINISALNLRESDLIEFLKEQKQELGVEPESIFIELTETSMMSNPLDAIEVLEKISELGMKVSVDDFGAGYSSLAYLKSLPAFEIKIDKSLVSGICQHKGNQLIAQATIEMCHKLGFKVVAEGVENEATLRLLQELNCDSVQGYLLTPPLPFDKIVSWINDYQNRQLNAS